jgi:broad specificity phosphatase PhoE
VILARHGRTAANEGTPVIRAWKDYQLDPAHKVDIQLTGNKLKDYKPGYIVSSDLMRDTETASILADMMNLANRETDFDARTWDMGLFEGQPLGDVNGAIEALMQRPWELPPGSSETYNDFSARWIKFLDRKMYLAANVAEMRPAVIVTHGKNIAAAQSYIDGIFPEKAMMPVPAGYAVISVGEDRSLGIEMYGETEPVIEDV